MSEFEDKQNTNLSTSQELSTDTDDALYIYEDKERFFLMSREPDGIFLSQMEALVDMALMLRVNELNCQNTSMTMGMKLFLYRYQRLDTNMN